MPLLVHFDPLSVRCWKLRRSWSSSSQSVDHHHVIKHISLVVSLVAMHLLIWANVPLLYSNLQGRRLSVARTSNIFRAFSWNHVQKLLPRWRKHNRDAPALPLAHIFIIHDRNNSSVPIRDNLQVLALGYPSQNTSHEPPPTIIILAFNHSESKWEQLVVNINPYCDQHSTPILAVQWSAANVDHGAIALESFY